MRFLLGSSISMASAENMKGEWGNDQRVMLMVTATK